MADQTDKKVLFIKRGSISSRDKAKLTKEGYVVIMSSVADPIIIQKADPPNLVFTNCYTCGERIYMTDERLTALKQSHEGFSCTYGHSSIFAKPKPPEKP